MQHDTNTTRWKGLTKSTLIIPLLLSILGVGIVTSLVMYSPPEVEIIQEEQAISRKFSCHIGEKAWVTIAVSKEMDNRIPNNEICTEFDIAYKMLQDQFPSKPEFDKVFE